MLLGTNLFAEVAEGTAVTNWRKMKQGALPRVKNQVLIKNLYFLQDVRHWALGNGFTIFTGRVLRIAVDQRMLYTSLYFPFITVTCIVGSMFLLPCCILDVVEADNCPFSHRLQPEGSPRGKTEYHLESLNFELDSATRWDFGFSSLEWGVFMWKEE